MLILKKQKIKMKRIAKLIIVSIALFCCLLVNPSWAGDIDNGAKIFTANCAACHMGGRNVVNPVKTLQKSDLEKYEMYDVVAIKNQVMNGKAAMPAFGNKLSAQEIDDVASYVISQADKGW